MIKNVVKKICDGIAFGFKNAEKEIFGENNSDSNIISVNQNVENEKLSRALLNGEETQEVKNLRYRTYKIFEKSKDFEYIGNGMAVKKKKRDADVENSEGMEIVVVQKNFELPKTLDEYVKLLNDDVKNDYIIKLSYKSSPRFRFEQFIHQIVAKKIDETHHQIDLYCPSYADMNIPFSRSFVNELNNIYSNKFRSNILDIDNIDFVTQYCYTANDLIKYSYDNIFFREIIFYKNSFILKFKAHLKNEPINLIKSYEVKEVDDKYNNKEKKDVVFNLSEIDNKEYICEECGKKMNNKNFLINGSDIEFFDAQIIKETYGKTLCKDCLMKVLEKEKASN